MSAGERRNGRRAEEHGRIERDLMLALAATARLEEGMRLCVEAALRISGCDAGGFYLLEPTKGVLELGYHTGLPPAFVASSSVFAADSAQFQMVMAGRPVYSHHGELDIAVPETRRKEALQAIAIIPILHQGAAIACLNVGSHHRQEIAGEDRLALETIAAGAAQVVVRLRAEEAMRENAENFRRFFETIDDLILVATLEGRIIFGNAAVERKLGYTPEEISRLTIADLHPPEAREEAAGILAEMFRGERQICPLPLARKDGGLLPAETRVWFGQWAGQRCLFGVCKDLSVEQEAQRRFESLFRRNPLPMALSHLPERHFADVNDAWIATLGFTRGELLGRTPQELDLFPDAERHGAAVAQFQAQGFVRDFELQIRTRDGNRRDVLVSGELLRHQGRSYILTVLVDITVRRRGEAMVRERLELQDQMASVAASVPGLICAFRLRPDGTASMPFATAAIEELYGLTPEDVREDFTPILNLVHPDDREQLGRTIGESARTMRPWHGTFRVRHPVKGLRWIEGHSVPRPEADGAVLWHGFIQDITARKRVEEELRDREFLLEEMGRLARIGGWEFDAGTGEGRWTDEVARIHDLEPGCQPSKEMGFTFYPGESRVKIEAAVEMALRTGEPYDLELDFVSAAGVRKRVRTMGLAVREGDRTVKLRGSIQDITDRKRFESLRETLLSLGRQLNSVRDAAGAGRALLGAVDRLWPWDAAALDLIAEGGDQVLPVLRVDTMGGEKREVPAGVSQLTERTRRVIARGAELILRGEQAGPAPDGMPFGDVGRPSASVLCVPVHRDTRIVGIFSLHSYQERAYTPEDLRVLQALADYCGGALERIRLEEQSRQSQKIEAVGQLAGGVAHDFNNILASMLINLGMLQQKPGADAETRQTLEELAREAKRAAGLTRQLLMFSRRSVLSVKPLDLNEVVDNLLKMLRRLIGEHITLRFEALAGLPLIEADAGLLEQVMVNLAVNARDAMPGGGRITIATTAEDLREADCAGRPEARAGRYVCLTTSDTGTGMPAETMQRIFEPFFTTKEAGKGTGLGLATVHGIVAQHKGWVEVASRVGEGTTFRVFLPALARKAETAPAAVPPAPPPRGRETILLVEDDATLRQVAALALRAFGYRVHPAANGREALALWERHGADVSLVLTDMVMPEGMNGLELVEHLRRLRPGLKAIVSSGYSTEMTRPGVLASAGVSYLPKPYEMATLAETVRRVLGESG